METDACEYARRLVKCGFTTKNAQNVCDQFLARYAADELEHFVRTTELIFDDRKEYAKEDR